MSQGEVEGMPGRVSEASGGHAPRRRWSLRTLVLAAMLAAFTTLVTAGAASADFWPHGEQGPLAVASR